MTADYLAGHAVVIESHGIELTLGRKELAAFSAVEEIMGGRLERVTDLRTGESVTVPTWPRPVSEAERNRMLDRERYGRRRRR